MEQGYLIDTNCIIDFAKGNLPDNARKFLSAVLDNQPFISVINKIEVLGFSNPGHAILELMKVASVISITDAIVDETIAIRRACKIKLHDAIIAATAVNKKLNLVTRNLTDFKIIQELVLVNPWDK